MFGGICGEEEKTKASLKVRLCLDRGVQSCVRRCTSQAAFSMLFAAELIFCVVVKLFDKRHVILFLKRQK